MAGAHAAGFGKLTILSSLGQPLRAEIELVSVARDEESQLVAKLASVDAYKQANIEFNPALLSLQFSIDQRGSRKFVRVTSTQPINEPFVAVLMELGGTKTRVLREYNVLLDPATSLVPQSPQVTAPMRKPPSAVSAIASAPSAGDATAFLPGARNDRSFPRYTEKKTSQAERGERRSTKTANAVATSDKLAATDYRVKKGDTLYQIAGNNLPSGISIDQMLVALYRGNQNAFTNKNINRLRSGQILSIPDADKARSVSASEAKTVILAISKDFNGYRNTLAGQLATAAPRDGDEAKQSGGGKITTKVEESANPANDAKDKLKLSRAGGAAKADAKSVAATEEQVAGERARVEADERVKLLEKNINDLQKVLDQKSKNLDALQKQADSSGKASAVAPVAPAAPATAVALAPGATGTTPTSSVASSALPVTTAGVPVAAGSALNAASVETPVPASPEAMIAKATTPPVPASSSQAVKLAGQAPIAAPVAQSGVLSDLADNPLLLPGAGILALLLAALGINKLRRKKRQGFLSDGGKSRSVFGSKTNSLQGVTGAQSAEKNSAFNTYFEPSVSSLDTNVDPVAEADVYIAYGRDVQAEEILKEALRNQPSRNAIRVKLLEIYAARKDDRAFEATARELYSLTAGAGEDWQQAAALGSMIDPSNPLYGRGHLPETIVAKAASHAVPMPMPMPMPMPVTGLDADVVPGSVEFLHAQERPLEVEDVAMPILSTPIETTLPPLKVASPAVVRPDMDFDFDFTPVKSPVAQPRPAMMPIPESAKNLMESLDFDLDHQSPAAVDFSAPGSPVQTVTPHKYTPAEPIEENFEGVPTLLVPVTHPSTVSPALAVAPLDFEFAGMNLDLDNLDDKRGSPQTTHHSLGGANPEMTTKLDLAVAYQEIGDDEGARELLEEVLKGGDVAQIATAKTLLGKLA
ncbi:FimV family protein [Glaciimonas sp. PAMC28666]|nr:FimV family protein [Glaciimonas sp. PAMC28666]